MGPPGGKPATSHILTSALEEARRAAEEIESSITTPTQESIQRITDRAFSLELRGMVSTPSYSMPSLTPMNKSTIKAVMDSQIVMRKLKLYQIFGLSINVPSKFIEDAKNINCLNIDNNSVLTIDEEAMDKVILPILRSSPFTSLHFSPQNKINSAALINFFKAFSETKIVKINLGRELADEEIQALNTAIKNAPQRHLTAVVSRLRGSIFLSTHSVDSFASAQSRHG